MIQESRASLSSNAVVVTTPVVELTWKLLPATPSGILYVRWQFIASTQKAITLNRIRCIIDNTNWYYAKKVSSYVVYILNPSFRHVIEFTLHNPRSSCAASFPPTHPPRKVKIV
jgi:hypothetical protein